MFFYKLKTRSINLEYFILVTHMGFEPMNVALRGLCVNHFTNGPKDNYILA